MNTTLMIKILSGLIIFSCGTDQKLMQRTAKESMQSARLFELQKTELTDNAFVSRNIGEFRGYAQINQFIRYQWLDPTDSSTNQFKIEEIAGRGIASQKILLGGEQNGSVAEFINGRPNPFNTMLWFKLMATIATGFASTCQQHSPALNFSRAPTGYKTFTLKPTIYDSIQNYCDDPFNQAHQLTLWLDLIGYTAPQSEYSAWSQFNLESDADLGQRLQGILMQPHFLLSQ